MTDKQRLFVDEYLIDLNATRAYRAVYKNVKSDDVAAVNATRLLRNANVTEYLEQRMKDRSERTEITQDDILKRLVAIVDADPTNIVKVVEKNGKQIVTIANTESLSEIDKSLIAGIKQGKNGIEVTLIDKIRVMELLGKHLGMWKEKVEVTGLDKEKSKLDDLVKQMCDGG